MNLENLMQNPYAWAILSLCTIVAFIFGIYTWIAGKKKKEISCFNNTFEVVKAGKSLVPKLELSYEGKEINDLTITKYAIWNSGNEVLNIADIVVESLQITCNNDTQILDARILVQSDETNMFKIIDKKNNCVKISFDYMDINDGIILQILHTGEAVELKVECKIKGGKKLKNLNHNTRKNDKYIMRTKKLSIILLGIDVFLLYMLSTLIILCEAGIISKEILKKTFLFRYTLNNNTVFIILLLILLAFVLASYWIVLKRTFYIGIPIKLRKNMEYDNYDNVL